MRQSRERTKKRFHERNDDRVVKRHRFNSRPGAVCKWFANGSCKFGDRCNFQHPLSPVSSKMQSISTPNYLEGSSFSFVQTPLTFLPPNGIIKVCEYFNKGKCRFGFQCLSIHIRPLSMPVHSTFFGRRQKNPYQKKGSNPGEDCRFYLRGNCQFGDQCRAIHNPKKVNIKGDKDQSYEEFTDEKLKKDSEKKLNNTHISDRCAFYLRGECRYKDRCKYEHSLGSDGQPPDNHKSSLKEHIDLNIDNNTSHTQELESELDGILTSSPKKIQGSDSYDDCERKNMIQTEEIPEDFRQLGNHYISSDHETEPVEEFENTRSYRYGSSDDLRPLYV